MLTARWRTSLRRSKPDSPQLPEWLTAEVGGMGGIGKTVLATALCRDPAVQRAFPDGIAWITIGREWGRDFVTGMREVGRALGEDVERGWDTNSACENSYRTILREKAALIVVDDVWNLEHLNPLLVDAPRSRFLFTTRDGSIVKTVTGRKYGADLLALDEARLLLARSSGRKSANFHRMLTRSSEPAMVWQQR
jgi:NB-ARC domain